MMKLFTMLSNGMLFYRHTAEGRRPDATGAVHDIERVQAASERLWMMADCGGHHCG